jgi:hypothetical protein
MDFASSHLGCAQPRLLSFTPSAQAVRAENLTMLCKCPNYRAQGPIVGDCRKFHVRHAGADQNSSSVC